MASFTAVYDACVLYPAPLRDFLMHLAMTELFRARWTETIHEEWMASVLAARPDLTRAQLERTRDLMNQAVPNCLVEGYSGLISGLTLPDPEDRHVLAAAIQAGVGVIVTFNLKDFPPAALETYGVEAQHPDEFITHLFDLAPGDVCAAAKSQRQRLKNPPKTTEEYLQALERQNSLRLLFDCRGMCSCSRVFYVSSPATPLSGKLLAELAPCEGRAIIHGITAVVG